MRISIIDAIKIQARVLIPVIKALEKELGKERAHQIVGDAIAESYAAYRAGKEPDAVDDPRAAGDTIFPVESEVVEDSETRYGVNMKACAFADYFRQIGEPEIGALMTCGVDFAVERDLRPSWRFERTQTLMQGARHCDFRWRRRAPQPESEEEA